MMECLAHKDLAHPNECPHCLKLQIEQLQKQLKSIRECSDAFEKGLSEEFHRRQDAERLNGELRSLLEYTAKQISHREPPHTVDEMHLEVPLTFKDNCLRCRVDKALGDVADKRKSACTHNAVNPTLGHTLCLKELPCQDHNKQVEPIPKDENPGCSPPWCEQCR